MTLLCLEYKVVSIGYFLDNMRYYEIRPLLDNMDRSVKSDWEQTRLVAYIMAQSNSSKKIKPTDIVSFSWDKKENTEKPTQLTAKQREEMIERARKQEKQLKEQGLI